MANRLKCLIIILIVLLGVSSAFAQQRAAQAPQSLRVYVFDCGLIKAMGVETYGFKQGEVTPKDFFVCCQPRGSSVTAISSRSFAADTR